MSSTSPTSTERVLAGIKVPDTPLVRSALALARAHFSDLTYNHVVRCWLYGILAASKSGPPTSTYDAEVHAVAALLHDLAWDMGRADFVSPNKRFEVDGADAARAFLDREAPDWDQRRRQLVWDAVALHATPSIARYKEVEVTLTGLGVACDLFGPGPSGGLLLQGELDRVADDFPRLDIRNEVRSLLCAICKHKPESRYDNFVGQMGDRHLDGFTCDGRRDVDFLDMIVS